MRKQTAILALAAILAVGVSAQVDPFTVPETFSHFIQSDATAGHNWIVTADGCKLENYVPAANDPAYTHTLDWAGSKCTPASGKDEYFGSMKHITFELLTDTQVTENDLFVSHFPPTCIFNDAGTIKYWTYNIYSNKCIEDITVAEPNQTTVMAAAYQNVRNFHRVQVVALEDGRIVCKYGRYLLNYNKERGECILAEPGCEDSEGPDTPSMNSFTLIDRDYEVMFWNDSEGRITENPGNRQREVLDLGHRKCFLGNRCDVGNLILRDSTVGLHKTMTEYIMYFNEQTADQGPKAPFMMWLSAQEGVFDCVDQQGNLQHISSKNPTWIGGYPALNLPPLFYPSPDGSNPGNINFMDLYGQADADNRKIKLKWTANGSTCVEMINGQPTPIGELKFFQGICEDNNGEITSFYGPKIIELNVDIPIPDDQAAADQSATPLTVAFEQPGSPGMFKCYSVEVGGTEILVGDFALTQDWKFSCSVGYHAGGPVAPGDNKFQVFNAPTKRFDPICQNQRQIAQVVIGATAADDTCVFEDPQNQGQSITGVYKRATHMCEDSSDNTINANLYHNQYQIHNQLAFDTTTSTAPRPPIIFDVQNGFCYVFGQCKAQELRMDRGQVKIWRKDFVDGTPAADAIPPQPFSCDGAPTRVLPADVVVGMVHIYDALIFDFSLGECFVTLDDGSQAVGSMSNLPYCQITDGSNQRVTAAKYATGLRGVQNQLIDQITQQVLQGVYRGQTLCMVSTEKCFAGNLPFNPTDPADQVITFNELELISDTSQKKEVLGIFDGESCRFDILPAPADHQYVTPKIDSFKCDSFLKMPPMPKTQAINTCLNVDYFNKKCERNGVMYTLDLVAHKCIEVGGTNEIQVDLERDANIDTHDRILVNLNSLQCYNPFVDEKCRQNTKLNVNWSKYDNLRDQAKAVINNDSTLAVTFKDDGSVVPPPIFDANGDWIAYGPQEKNQFEGLANVFNCEHSYQSDDASQNSQPVDRWTAIFVGRIQRQFGANDIKGKKITLNIMDPANVKCHVRNEGDPTPQEILAADANAQPFDLDVDTTEPELQWRCKHPSDTSVVPAQLKYHEFSIIGVNTFIESLYATDGVSYITSFINTFDSSCFILQEDGQPPMRYRSLIKTDHAFICNHPNSPTVWIERFDEPEFREYHVFGYINHCQEEQPQFDFTCDDGTYPEYDPPSLREIQMRNDVGDIISQIIDQGGNWHSGQDDGQGGNDQDSNLSRFSFIHGEQINMGFDDAGALGCQVRYGCSGEVFIPYAQATNSCDDPALGIFIDLTVNGFKVNGQSTTWTVDLVRGRCYKADDCSPYFVWVQDATTASAGNFKCVKYGEQPSTGADLTLSSTEATIIGFFKVETEQITFNVFPGFDQGYTNENDGPDGQEDGQDDGPDGEGEGPDGENPDNGQDGPDGPDGQDGQDGQDGPNGPNGPDGPGEWGQDENPDFGNYGDNEDDDEQGGFQGPQGDGPITDEDNESGFRRLVAQLNRDARRLQPDFPDNDNGPEAQSGQNDNFEFGIYAPYDASPFFFDQEIQNNNIFVCPPEEQGNGPQVGGRPGDCFVGEEYRGRFIKEISACVQDVDGVPVITQVRDYNSFSITPSADNPRFVIFTRIEKCLIDYTETAGVTPKQCDLRLDTAALSVFSDFDQDDVANYPTPFKCHCANNEVIDVPFWEIVFSPLGPNGQQQNDDGTNDGTNDGNDGEPPVYTPPEALFIGRVWDLIDLHFQSLQECQIPYVIDFSEATVDCKIGGLSKTYDAAAFTCDGNDLSARKWDVDVENIHADHDGWLVDVWNMRAFNSKERLPYRVSVEEWAGDQAKTIVLTRNEFDGERIVILMNPAPAGSTQDTLNVVGKRFQIAQKIVLTLEVQTQNNGKTDVVPTCKWMSNETPPVVVKEGRFDGERVVCLDQDGALFANVQQTKQIQIRNMFNAFEQMAQQNQGNQVPDAQEDMISGKNFAIIAYSHGKCYMSGIHGPNFSQDNDNGVALNLETKCSNNALQYSCVKNNGEVIKSAPIWGQSVFAFGREVLDYSQDCFEQVAYIDLKSEQCYYNNKEYKYLKSGFICKDTQSGETVELFKTSYRVWNWQGSEQGKFLIDEWKQVCWHQHHCIAFELIKKGTFDVTDPELGTTVSQPYYVCGLKRGNKQFKFEVKNYVSMGRAGKVADVAKIDITAQECKNAAGDVVGKLFLKDLYCLVDVVDADGNVTSKVATTLRAINNLTVEGLDNIFVGGIETFFFMKKCFIQGEANPGDIFQTRDSNGNYYITCSVGQNIKTYESCELQDKTRIIAVRQLNRCDYSEDEFSSEDWWNVLSIVDPIAGKCQFKWINSAPTFDAADEITVSSTACGGPNSPPYEYILPHIRAWRPDCPLDTPPQGFPLGFENIADVQVDLDVATGRCGGVPIDELPNYFLHAPATSSTVLKDYLYYGPRNMCISLTFETDRVVFGEPFRGDISEDGTTACQDDEDTDPITGTDLLTLGSMIYAPDNKRNYVNVYSDRCEYGTQSEIDGGNAMKGPVNDKDGVCYFNTGILDLCDNKENLQIDFEIPPSVTESCEEFHQFDAALLTCDTKDGQIGFCQSQNGDNGIVEEVFLYNIFWDAEENDNAMWIAEELRQKDQKQGDQGNQGDDQQDGPSPVMEGPCLWIAKIEVLPQFNGTASGQQNPNGQTTGDQQNTGQQNGDTSGTNQQQEIIEVVKVCDCSGYCFDLSDSIIDILHEEVADYLGLDSLPDAVTANVDLAGILTWVQAIIQPINNQIQQEFTDMENEPEQEEDIFRKCYTNFTVNGEEKEIQFIKLNCPGPNGPGTGLAKDGNVIYANEWCDIQGPFPVAEFLDQFIPQAIQSVYQSQFSETLTCDQGNHLLKRMAYDGAQLELGITCKHFNSGESYFQHYGIEEVKVLNKGVYFQGPQNEGLDDDVEEMELYIIKQLQDETSGDITYKCARINQHVMEGDLPMLIDIWAGLDANKIKDYVEAEHKCGNKVIQEQYRFIIADNLNVDYVADPRTMQCYTKQGGWWALEVSAGQIRKCTNIMNPTQLISFVACGEQSVQADYQMFGNVKFAQTKIVIDMGDFSGQPTCIAKVDGTEYPVSGGDSLNLNIAKGTCTAAGLEVSICSSGFEIKPESLTAWFADEKKKGFVNMCDYTCTVNPLGFPDYEIDPEEKWRICGEDEINFTCCAESALAMIDTSGSDDDFAPEGSQVKLEKSKIRQFARETTSYGTQSEFKKKNFLIYFFEEMSACVDQDGRLYKGQYFTPQGIFTGIMYCDYLWDDVERQYLVEQLTDLGVEFNPDPEFDDPQYFGDYSVRIDEFGDMVEAGYDLQDCNHTYQLGMETVQFALDHPNVNRSMIVVGRRCYQATADTAGNLFEGKLVEKITIDGTEQDLKPFLRQNLHNLDDAGYDVMISCENPLSSGNQIIEVKLGETIFLGRSNAFSETLNLTTFPGHILMSGILTQTFRAPDETVDQIDVREWVNANGDKVYSYPQNRVFKCDGNCDGCQYTPFECVGCPSEGTWHDCFGTCIKAADLATEGLWIDASNSNSCEECIPGCLECSDGTTCTTCTPEFFKVGTECLTYGECYDNGNYVAIADDGTESCNSCPTGASLCYEIMAEDGSAEEFVEICAATGGTDYYLKDGACVTDCGAGFTTEQDVESGEGWCIPCLEYCNTCIDSTTCGTTAGGDYDCKAPFIAIGNECFFNCLPTQYADVSTGNCEACSSVCSDGCGSGPNDCMCNETGDGFEGLSDMMTTFGPECYTQSECTGAGRVTFEGVDEEYDYSIDDFVEVNVKRCIKCHSSCTGNCDGPWPEDCLEGCSTDATNEFPYFIDGFGCSQECPEFTVDMGSKVCGCPTGCNRCDQNTNGDTICFECDSASATPVLASDHQSCIAACPDNEFEILNSQLQKVCKACPDECPTGCTQTNTEDQTTGIFASVFTCSTCATDFVKQEYTLPDGTTTVYECQSECNNGYYSVSGVCTSCMGANPDPTQTGDCESDGNGGYVFVTELCPSECNTCNGTKCTSCASGNVLTPTADGNGLTCVAKSVCAEDKTRRIQLGDCPLGFGSSAVCDRCVKCPEGCEECNTPQGCTKCGNNLKETFEPIPACVQNCGEGFFSQSGQGANSSKKCKLVNPVCKTGNSATNCDSCYPGQSVKEFTVQSQLGAQQTQGPQQGLSNLGTTYKLCFCDGADIKVTADPTYTQIKITIPKELKLNTPMINVGFPVNFLENTIGHVYQSYLKTQSIAAEITQLANLLASTLPQGQAFYNILQTSTMDDIASNHHATILELAREQSIQTVFRYAPKSYIQNHFGQRGQDFLDSFTDNNFPPTQLDITPQLVNSGAFNLVNKLFPTSILTKFKSYTQNLKKNNDGSLELTINLPDNHSVNPSDKIWFNDVFNHQTCPGLIKRDFSVPLASTNNNANIKFQVIDNAVGDFNVAPCKAANLEIQVTNAIQNFSKITSKKVFVQVLDNSGVVTTEYDILENLGPNVPDADRAAVMAVKNTFAGFTGFEKLVKFNRNAVGKLEGYQVKISFTFGFKFVSDKSKSVTLKFTTGSIKEVTVQTNPDAIVNLPNDIDKSFKIPFTVISCGENVNQQQFVLNNIQLTHVCVAASPVDGAHYNPLATGEITFNPQSSRINFPAKIFHPGQITTCTFTVVVADDTYTGPSPIVVKFRTIAPLPEIYTIHLPNPIKLTPTTDYILAPAISKWNPDQHTAVISCKNGQGQQCKAQQAVLDAQSQQNYWAVQDIFDAAMGNLLAVPLFDGFFFAPIEIAADTLVAGEEYRFKFTLHVTGDATKRSIATAVIKCFDDTSNIIEGIIQSVADISTDQYIDLDADLKFFFYNDNMAALESRTTSWTVEFTESEPTDSTTWNTWTSGYVEPNQFILQFTEDALENIQFYEKYFRISYLVDTEIITSMQFNTVSGIKLDSVSITPSEGLTTTVDATIKFEGTETTSTNQFEVFMYYRHHFKKPRSLIGIFDSLEFPAKFGTHCKAAPVDANFNCRAIMVVGKYDTDGFFRIKIFTKKLDIIRADINTETFLEELASASPETIGNLLASLIAQQSDPDAAAVDSTVLQDSLNSSLDLLPKDQPVEGSTLSSTMATASNPGVSISATQASELNTMVNNSIQVTVGNADDASNLMNSINSNLSVQTSQIAIRRRRLQEADADAAATDGVDSAVTEIVAKFDVEENKTLLGIFEQVNMFAENAVGNVDVNTPLLTESTGVVQCEQNKENKISKTDENGDIVETKFMFTPKEAPTSNKDIITVCEIASEATDAEIGKRTGLGTNNKVIAMGYQTTKTELGRTTATAIAAGAKAPTCEFKDTNFIATPVAANATEDERRRYLESIEVELRVLKDGEWIYYSDCTLDGTVVTCEGVEMNGTYSVFQKGSAMIEESKMHTDRLFNGFILYCTLLIDIYLVVGLIFGNRLQAQSQKVDVKVTEDQHKQSKMYTGVEADDGKWATKTADMNTHVNVQESNVPHPNPNGPSFSTGTSVKIYHRCTNIYASQYHELSRPLRALSFALQLMVQTLIIGAAIELYAMEQPIEIVLSIIVAFLVTRITNFVFNQLLGCAQNSGGGLKWLVVISLALFYLACHGIAIYIAVAMMEADFTAFTVAFLASIVVEIIVWELIVAVWQHKQMKNNRESKNLCCKFAVSKALMRAYFV